MKKPPRNNYALSAKTRRSKVRKHKGALKGGSKNEQSEFLSEKENIISSCEFQCSCCSFRFEAIDDPDYRVACPGCSCVAYKCN
jgi:hypothetical protein